MRDGRGDSRFVSRWICVASTAIMGSCLLVVACAPDTKYRVLNFLFDGVPEPGATSNTTSTNDRRASAASETSEPTPRAPSRVRLYPHKPYRDGQCTGCHSLETGELVRPANEGLCLICHQDVPGKVRYVHGPVAVKQCTQCHHYHASPFPKLMLKETLATCYECHDRTDLTTGEHHSDLEKTSCVECHDPHGGSERYFLKRAGL